MGIQMIGDFIMDVKDWVYGWDMVTLVLVGTILITLMIMVFINIIKGLVAGKDAKPKFKIVQFIFLALLTTMLVLILLIRI